MKSEKFISAGYVAAQFTLLILIFYFGSFPKDIFGWFLLIGGILLGFIAIYTMNFRVSVFPMPKKGNFNLITSGPYKYIRHPMYTALFLWGLSWILNELNVVLLILYLGLILLLFFKSEFEERKIRRIHPEYKKYSLKTKKFIPYLF